MMQSIPRNEGDWKFKYKIRERDRFSHRWATIDEIGRYLNVELSWIISFFISRLASPRLSRRDSFCPMISMIVGGKGIGDADWRFGKRVGTAWRTTRSGAAARFRSRPKSSPGKEARKASQRWLMPVTNTTIQGSHLRDIRNPIRGFDLHKPTLDRVTRGHLTSAHLHAAASKDGRCSFAAIFAIMRSDHSAVAHPPCPFFDLRFQVNHPLCRPSLRLVSRLRETWQTWPIRSNRSLRGRGETMENQDIILSPGFLI